MSFITKLLSKKKSDKILSSEQAVQKLRDIEILLGRKQEFLEKRIEEEVDTARKHGSKNKRAALQALKRKKRNEKLLQQIDGTLTTIELQREALENAKTHSTVLKTMKIAADALKVAHNNLNVEDVQDIIDDITEQNDLSNEICEAIGRPIGFDEGILDDELEKELEELEQELLNTNLLNTQEVETKLPEVPNQEPSDVKTGMRNNQKKRNYLEKDLM